MQNAIYRYINNIMDTRAKWMCILILLISLLSAIAVTLSPIFISRITALLTPAKSNTLLIVYLLGIAYILVISLNKIFNITSLFLQSHLRTHCISGVSKEYFQSIYRNPSIIGENQNSGDISQKLNQATNDIYMLISNISFSLVPPIFQLVIALTVILSSKDWVVALLFFTYTITFSSFSILTSSMLIVKRKALMASGLKTYSLLIDSVQNFPVVRTFNCFDFFFQRFNNGLTNDINSQQAYWKVTFILMCVSGLLQILFFGSSFIYTLYHVINGTTTLSHFILISSYLLVISSPLENLGQAFTSFMQTYRSLGGFVKDLKMVPAKDIEPITHVTNQAVLNLCLKEVCFRYPGNENFQFGPVSLTLSKGKFITITGKSGAGKSTLLKILTRNISPSSGSYFIAQHDAKALSDDEFYRMTAYVSQDDYVFMDTVRFNLQIANPEASDEQLLDALAKANLTFKDEENGSTLDRNITNEGGNLSGGQRQKLSLARLFLRNPAIIFLDEITSSLDIPTEKKLLQQIRDTFTQAVIINVSHRPSTFVFSDEIVIIGNGHVLEHGPYSQLKTNNSYLNDIIKAT